MQAVVSPFAGRLSDRLDPGIIASAGMGLTTLGLFILVFLNETTPLLYFIAALIHARHGFRVVLFTEYECDHEFG